MGHRKDRGALHGLSRRTLVCSSFGGLVGALFAADAWTAATVVESRPVSGFDSVRFGVAGELTIRQTGREHLTIEAEPRLLPLIVTEVRQRELTIGFGPHNVSTREPLRFVLDVDVLRRFETSAASNVSIGALRAADLSLQLGGSGGVRIDALEARSLDLALTGAIQVWIGGGRVQRQRVAISGSGDHEALALGCDQAEVSISGSGTVRVAVAQRLNASIAGAGNVRYRGDPVVTRTVTGAGSIDRVGVSD